MLFIAGSITGPESPPSSGKCPPGGTVGNLGLVYLTNKFGTTEPVADIAANGLVEARNLYILDQELGQTS